MFYGNDVDGGVYIACASKPVIISDPLVGCFLIFCNRLELFTVVLLYFVVVLDHVVLIVRLSFATWWLAFLDHELLVVLSSNVNESF